MGLIILERVMAELAEGTPRLPYPIKLSFRGGSLTLSTFSEEDREAWLNALSKASRELLDVQIQVPLFPLRGLVEETRRG